MFRSMTTTSGASSRDEPHRRLAVRRLADHVDALLVEQVREAGAKEVVVVDEQHAAARRFAPCAFIVSVAGWAFTGSARG